MHSDRDEIESNSSDEGENEDRESVDLSLDGSQSQVLHDLNESIFENHNAWNENNNLSGSEFSALPEESESSTNVTGSRIQRSMYHLLCFESFMSFI